MNINIRNAEFEDLTELQNLFSETIMETCQNEYSLNERKVWSNAIKKTEKWKKSLRQEFFIVAESNGEIIGFSSLKNQNYLNLMYIHKDFTRKGIASRLYENIKAKSIKYGTEKLSADVSKTARPFFEKLGFRVLKENRNVVENEVVINYNMTE
jgi:putative acetyltransferase